MPEILPSLVELDSQRWRVVKGHLSSYSSITKRMNKGYKKKIKHVSSVQGNNSATHYKSVSSIKWTYISVHTLNGMGLIYKKVCYIIPKVVPWQVQKVVCIWLSILQHHGPVESSKLVVFYFSKKNCMDLLYREPNTRLKTCNFEQAWQGQ